MKEKSNKKNDSLPYIRLYRESLFPAPAVMTFYGILWASLYANELDLNPEHAFFFS